MNTYISTGNKILRHLPVLKRFQSTGVITPISLQIAPTSRCNLKCCFCSNVNRKKNQDLDPVDIFEFLGKMRNRGAKSVEWTGGGDPTQYPYILDVMCEAERLGFEQGIITNGIDLIEKVGVGFDSPRLRWIRISLNSLDYVPDIEIPKHYGGVLGFSYVINDKTKKKTINKILDYVKKFNPRYVRIVPNCQDTSEGLSASNKIFSKEVSKWGPPFFFQEKVFSTPKRCWWGYFKPFLLHDGYVYRCSSIVLNYSANRSFHKKFRWSHMKEFPHFADKRAIPFDCKDCTNCVFQNQNDLVESCIDTNMENFV